MLDNPRKQDKDGTGKVDDERDAQWCVVPCFGAHPSLDAGPLPCPRPLLLGVRLGCGCSVRALPPESRTQFLRITPVATSGTSTAASSRY